MNKRLRRFKSFSTQSLRTLITVDSARIVLSLVIILIFFLYGINFFQLSTVVGINDNFSQENLAIADAYKLKTEDLSTSSQILQLQVTKQLLFGPTILVEGKCSK